MARWTCSSLIAVIVASRAPSSPRRAHGQEVHERGVFHPAFLILEVVTLKCEDSKSRSKQPLPWGAHAERESLDGVPELLAHIVRHAPSRTQVASDSYHCDGSRLAGITT